MNNKITCVIVDDEKTAREGIQLLVTNIVEIDLIHTCRSGIEALEKINEFHPDILLLDIQMPNLNGFEVLQHSKFIPPAIIFITAHDEYAIKAFEVHAVDYLLKPFNDDRFFEAMKRAMEKVNSRKTDQNLQALLHGTKHPGNRNDVIFPDHGSDKNKKLVIKVDGKIHFIPIQEIKWIEAYDYYIKIHVGHAFHLLRETMKKIIQKLPDKDFIRIHKSSIVNVNHIERIEYLTGSEMNVVLKSAEVLKVSRTFKPELLKRFEVQ